MIIMIKPSSIKAQNTATLRTLFSWASSRSIGAGSGFGFGGGDGAWGESNSSSAFVGLSLSDFSVLFSVCLEVSSELATQPSVVVHWNSRFLRFGRRILCFEWLINRIFAHTIVVHLNSCYFLIKSTCSINWPLAYQSLMCRLRLSNLSVTGSLLQACLYTKCWQQKFKSNL